MTIKKKLLLGFLLFIGCSNLAKADTDISSMDNVLYIESFSTEQGKNIELSIKMKNSAAIRGYQFELTLPEGLTFTKNGSGLYTITTNADRAASYSPSATVNDGDMHTTVLGSTMSGVDISGTDGEILKIAVSVDADATLGAHTITLSNIVLGTVNTSVSYSTAEVTSTITIAEPTGYDVLLNEELSDVPTSSDGAVTVKVKRTISANKWSTICLPFDMTETQVKEAFGNDVQLAEFVSYEINADNTEIVVEFSDVDLSSEGFLGNWPYIIKTTTDITDFTVSDITISSDEEQAIAEYAEGKGKQRHVYGSFIGTLHAGVTLPNNSLFLNNNKFWYSKGQTVMKAFRAYFEFEDVLASVENAPSSVRYFISDRSGNTTQIDIADTEILNTGKIYSLSGTCVGDRASMDRLPKGIYIVNGKKIVK